MSERKSKSRRIKKLDAARRLADDLSRLDLDIAASREATGVEEMLPLIIEEANKGVDISKRYPNFYKKLLNHPDLRQAFLDILESMEDEEQNQPVLWAGTTGTKLDFLADSSSQPVVARLGDQWRISFQRTIEQLQAIFSPSELAYRSDPALSEDLWFTLLREEIESEDLLYTIVLECTFSEENVEALSPFLNVAVTIGATTKQSSFPIQASLQWGTHYKESLQINEEGRVRFPDIPFKTIFDEEQKSIKAELQLTLQPPT